MTAGGDRHPGDFRAAFSLLLNASIRGPQSLRISGFPIKDFGNDKRKQEEYRQN